MRRTTIVIALALVPFLPAPSQAQQTPPATTTPTIQVYSRETIVDVIVTDDHGQPVHGLAQSDFTIAENGKRQPIRSFKEFGDGPPAPTRTLPRLPPGIYTNYQAVPASGPVQFLLLDAIHTPYGLMDIFEKQAAQYIWTMPAGTQMAIFWLSQSGLHMLQPFTSDRDLLSKAVVTNRADFGWIGDGWSRNMATIAAFNQIAAYVAGIRGRKNLLWVTPGMPVSLTRDGGYSWANPPNMTLVHRLMDTYELLTAAEVAVCPVDPTGPHAMGKNTLQVEAVAEDTGGIAIYNTNDIASAIAKVVDQGSSFYTLSYIPPKSIDDGHYHHITVEVSRPGLHLVYRKGYNAEPTPQTIADRGPALMKASMEGNAPSATQLLFDAQVTPAPQAVSNPAKPSPNQPRRAPTPTIPYDIVYMLPASQIAFNEAPDGTRLGSLEFDVAAYDNDRKLVALISQTMKLPLTPERYRSFIQTPFHFSQQLNLPPGQLTLRVGILDGVSSKVGTLEVSLMVLTPQQLADMPSAAPAPCPPRCPLPAPTTSTAHH